MKHIHKAIPRRDHDGGWSICVTPMECAAKPERQAAHGNITRTDYCSCGAKRLTEINITARNYGPWIEPDADKGGRYSR